MEPKISKIRKDNVYYNVGWKFILVFVVACITRDKDGTMEDVIKSLTVLRIYTENSQNSADDDGNYSCGLYQRIVNRKLNKLEMNGITR